MSSGLSTLALKPISAMRSNNRGARNVARLRNCNTLSELVVPKAKQLCSPAPGADAHPESQGAQRCHRLQGVEVVSARFLPRLAHTWSKGAKTLDNACSIGCIWRHIEGI